MVLFVVLTAVASAALPNVTTVLFATMLLLVVSAVVSAIVDNIPYVAAMAPLVTQLVEAQPDAHQATVLWWALALGPDRGGNATAIGASANVVAIGLAGRSGHRISFWEFTKFGTVVAIASVALCVYGRWNQIADSAGSVAPRTGLLASSTSP